MHIAISIWISSIYQMTCPKIELVTKSVIFWKPLGSPGTDAEDWWLIFFHASSKSHFYEAWKKKKPKKDWVASQCFLIQKVWIQPNKDEFAAKRQNVSHDRDIIVATDHKYWWGIERRTDSVRLRKVIWTIVFFEISSSSKQLGPLV